jgi:hypothetical protein
MDWQHFHRRLLGHRRYESWNQERFGRCPRQDAALVVSELLNEFTQKWLTAVLRSASIHTSKNKIILVLFCSRTDEVGRWEAWLSFKLTSCLLTAMTKNTIERAMRIDQGSEARYTNNESLHHASTSKMIETMAALVREICGEQVIAMLRAWGGWVHLKARASLTERYLTPSQKGGNHWSTATGLLQAIAI